MLKWPCLCESSNCINLSDWQASQLAMFLNKECRMHRNILEHCQSHVCLVDPASLALWLADLTLPDRPIALLPLIAKGYRYISVCWNRFHFNVISINPLKATRSEYFSLPYLWQIIAFWKVPVCPSGKRCRWRWVWSMNGMTVTKETWNDRRKTCPATLSITNLIWLYSSASSYRVVYTLRLGFKNQSVNAV